MTQTEAIAQLEIATSNVRNGLADANELKLAIMRCKRAGIGKRIINAIIRNQVEICADKYFKGLCSYSN